jgi:hypothetical protein
MNRVGRVTDRRIATGQAGNQYSGQPPSEHSEDDKPPAARKHQRGGSPNESE